MGTLGKISVQTNRIVFNLTPEGALLCQEVLQGTLLEPEVLSWAADSPSRTLNLLRSGAGFLVAALREHAAHLRVEQSDRSKQILEFADAADDLVQSLPYSWPMPMPRFEPPKKEDDRSLQKKADKIWRHIVGHPEEMTIWGTPRQKTNKFLGCDFSSDSDSVVITHIEMKSNPQTSSSYSPEAKDAPRNRSEKVLIPYKMSPAVQKTTLVR